MRVPLSGLMVMLGWLGCNDVGLTKPGIVTGLTCGEGTYEEDEVCVADETSVPADDGEAPDDGEPADDGGPADDGEAPDDGEPPDDGDPGDDGDPADDGAPADDGEPADDGSPPEDTAPPITPATTRVYLLAGQSNMDGGGSEISLPPELRVAQEDVHIYWSGSPAWRGLVPSSMWSSGYGIRFGPEITFGRTLADALPADDIHLIKHAVGGTTLAEYWHPGEDGSDTVMGPGYTDFMATISGALETLEAEGRTPELAGMIWMQGESDAADGSFALEYESRLTHFIERVRTDVDTPELPFVIGLIDCEGLCTHRALVRTAQMSVAEADPMVFTIETEDLGRYSDDPWHYHGVGMRVMGERFAQALLDEPMPTVPQPAFTLTGTYTHSYYGAFTTGYTFRVDRPIQVTDLGLFDLGGDGINHATDIGIWHADSGDLIVTETLPASESAASPLIGQFRYVGISPTLLEPGEYALGAEAFASSPDFYVYEAEISSADGMTWLEGRHAEGSFLSFPTIITPGSADATLWFGPNLLFREIGG